MRFEHKIDTYKEGWQRVEFCTVCGKEGQELDEECKPQQKSEAQLELFVDSQMEQH